MNIDATEIERRIVAMAGAVQRAGMRLTPQRLAIFREIAGTLEHPDAETVHRAVARRMPGVSLDTVYRTLQALCDLGLATTLGPRHNRVRFDANLGRHHHFVCERCGLARDFESSDLDALPVPAAARAFGRVVTARVEVRGVCADCLDRESAGNPPATARRKISDETKIQPVTPAWPRKSGPDPARRGRKP